MTFEQEFVKEFNACFQPEAKAITTPNGGFLITIGNKALGFESDPQRFRSRVFTTLEMLHKRGR